MNLEKEKLQNIVGGATTINASIAKVLISLVELIKGAGEDLGSSIRRITAGEICPLN